MPHDWTPNHALTEKSLRARMGISPGYAVNLFIIPDAENGKDKPDKSLPDLLKLAIFGAEGHKLTVSGIYQAFKDRFPYYRDLEAKDDAAWKNSIRHELSKRQIYVQVDMRPGQAKPRYWTLDTTRTGDKRPKVNKKSMKWGGIEKTHKQQGTTPSTPATRELPTPPSMIATRRSLSSLAAIHCSSVISTAPITPPRFAFAAARALASPRTTYQSSTMSPLSKFYIDGPTELRLAPIRRKGSCGPRTSRAHHAARSFWV
ncbi:hypothetical protein HWV62_36957 [Athelia sp. TMB]|nr:hypothetical protein HWV62_36957 [Athelia sp. TMB]